MVIDFVGDFLKFIAVGGGPITVAGFGTLGYMVGCAGGCTTIWGGTAGATSATVRGAEGNGRYRLI